MGLEGCRSTAASNHGSFFCSVLSLLLVEERSVSKRKKKKSWFHSLNATEQKAIAGAAIAQLCYQYKKVHTKRGIFFLFLFLFLNGY